MNTEEYHNIIHNLKDQPNYELKDGILSISGNIHKNQREIFCTMKSQYKLLVSYGLKVYSTYINLKLANVRTND